MDREKERQIVIEGRKQGKSDDFIKQAVLRYRQTAPKQPVAPLAQPAEEAGYFSRVAESFGEAGQNIKSEIQQGAQEYQTGTQKGTFAGDIQATAGLLRSGLRTAGNIAGAAFSPILEAPIVKPTLEKIGLGVSKLPGVSDLVSKTQEITKKYPEATKDIEAIVNIATLGGGKAVEKPLEVGAKAVGTETKLIGQDVAQGLKNVLNPSEEAVQSKVQSLFQKSIKPTSKKTLALGEKYENDTLEALKTIQRNKDTLNIEDMTGELVVGRSPQSINELAQAVDQTKKTVFSQYDSLAKQAGKEGAFIDAQQIANEVEQVAKNKALQITNPELIKYANDWSERLRGFGSLDPETTQAVIQNLNNNLQAFYRNPTYDAATKVAIDAGIANNFRQALDKTIETATGKEYQALKKQYGALKAIENDVTRAAMREGRKNTKGLLDYTDIFTGGQMVGGILSLNPAMFTKGAVERGIKEYIKFINDPNRAVKNIFDQLEKTTSTEFVPKSKTLQSVIKK